MTLSESANATVKSEPLPEVVQSSSESDEETVEPRVSNKFAAFMTADEEESEDNSEEEDESEPVIGNKFDLLLNNDEVDDEEEEEEDEDEGVSEPSLEPVRKQQSTKKKQKKRKRNKGKQKKDEANDDEDWEVLANATTEDEVGLIDETLFASDDDDELRANAQEIYNTIHETYMIERAKRERKLMEYMGSLGESLKVITVDSRMLSADSELKKLFGARVVEAERRNEEAEQAASAGGRRRRGRRAHAGVRVKKNNLVTPRDGWMHSAPGLSMVQDNSEELGKSVKYFRYEYEGVYAKLQSEYRTAVLSHDINNIAALVAKFPCHVDSLLQLAEVYRQMGELDRAAEHIERALCILEAAWAPTFKPWNGECRLKFSIAENKGLYVALSRYAQLLSRRGLHRTALEISKLVLGFDPDFDPMGILLVMDSLAILANEHVWVWEMNQSFKLIPLQYFPNFAISAALAMFNIQESMTSGKKGKKGKKGRIMVEDVPKEWNEIDTCKLLSDALVTFPMILRPLLAATKDSGGSWSSHKLFSENGDYGVLNRIARIYAARANLLWTAPKSKALLHRAAEMATRAGPKKIEDAKLARRDAENWFVEKGLYRSLQLADFVEGAPELNAELMAPENTVNVGAPEVRNVAPTEAMREFIHSLLPWRDTNDAAAAAAAADAGTGDGTQYRDYMDVVRQVLLGNNQNNADADDERGEQDETQR